MRDLIIKDGVAMVTPAFIDGLWTEIARAQAALDSIRLGGLDLAMASDAIKHAHKRLKALDQFKIVDGIVCMSCKGDGYVEIPTTMSADPDEVPRIDRWRCIDCDGYGGIHFQGNRRPRQFTGGSSGI
jgi:hypothetical protein